MLRLARGFGFGLLGEVRNFFINLLLMTVDVEEIRISAFREHTKPYRDNPDAISPFSPAVLHYFVFRGFPLETGESGCQLYFHQNPITPNPQFEMR